MMSMIMSRIMKIKSVIIYYPTQNKTKTIKEQVFDTLFLTLFLPLHHIQKKKKNKIK